MLWRVAPSRCNVLVTGESGTGKEVVVRTLHGMSPRKDAPLVAVNCGAVADNLVESELFGHARGAFTGAMTARRGYVAAAEGGTLFLDEVGELSLAAQVKLLRLDPAARVHAGRRDEGDQVRCPRRRRDEPRPRGRGEGGALPRGPLFPSRRHSLASSASPRASRGNPTSRAVPARALRRAHRAHGRDRVRRWRTGAPRVRRLAGERPRSRELHRARRAPHPGDGDHARRAPRPAYSPAPPPPRRRSR